VSERIPKHKALKLIERAQGHLLRSEFPQAEALLRQVLHSASPVPGADGFLGDALAGQGRDDEAMALWVGAWRRAPHDPELCARIGTSLSRRGRTAEALPFLERAQADRRKDPGTLVHLAFALAQAGRVDEAEKAAGRAVQAGAGAEGRVVLAVVRGQQGRYAEAERLCLEAEERGGATEVADAARAVRADARLFQGDAAGALAQWKALRQAGRMEKAHLAHMAYAAQLAGEVALCDELVAERAASGPTSEDLLLFAQISNLRGRPERALLELSAAEDARGEGFTHPGHAFEVQATRGRALRLLGRRDEARATLEALLRAPEAQSRRLGPKVRVDLGHLCAEDGAFEDAAAHFGAALSLDPEEPEARHGLELTRRRVAWRDELAASAEAKVEAARAEAEALRRRFSSREGELEALRAELARLRGEQEAALEKARRAEEEAKLAAQNAQVEQKRKLREELLAREAEAEEKGEANIDAALGEAKAQCPPSVLQGFLVAEKTFQKALYTDLPAAAVAVLYAGALERALYTFFVDRFRGWLREKGRLSDFLKGAVRERRGTRVEYFDHFVEAFDEERPGRAPSLGEVGRVIERRRELYLSAFRDFLEQQGWDDAFLDALADFVKWSKENLRDPVAHGRGETVSYEQLRRFREQVLVDLGGTGRSALRHLAR
jgi:tetratricopeptide (TPR) repeat protein